MKVNLLLLAIVLASNAAFHSNSANGKIVLSSKKVSIFVPTYEWQVVQNGQSIPPGLATKLPLDGGQSQRMSRIPPSWQLSLYVDSPFEGSRRGFERLSVGRHTTLANVLRSLSQRGNAPMESVSLLSTCSHVTNESLALHSATMEDLNFFNVKSCVKVHIEPHPPENAHALVRHVHADEDCGHNEMCNKRYLKIRAVCDSESPEYADPLVCEWRRKLFSACMVACVARDGSKSGKLMRIFSKTRYHLQQARLALTHLPLVEWGREESLPGDNTWLRCQSIGACRYSRGVLHMEVDEGQRSSLPREIMAGRHWPYFPEGAKIMARTSISPATDSGCARYLHAPTFLVSSWSVDNVFHLLSDIILPVAAAMISRDIPLRDNAILFLDIGHPWQRPRLLRILRGDYSPNGDGPAQLLATLTGSVSRVFAKAELDSLSGKTCFSNLQLGAPFRGTALDYGFRMGRMHGPLASPMGSFETEEARSIIRDGKGMKNSLRLEKFSKNSAMNDPWWAPNDADGDAGTVFTFIRRSGSRRILNFDALKNALSERYSNATVRAVQLEEMPFVRQLRLFSETSVLIGAHGQGLANVVLMRPAESSAVIAMPRTFFGWHFLYANMALEAGVMPFVLAGMGDMPLDRAADWNGVDDQDRYNAGRDLPLRIAVEPFLRACSDAAAAVRQDRKTAGEEGDEDPPVSISYYLQ